MNLVSVTHVGTAPNTTQSAGASTIQNASGFLSLFANVLQQAAGTPANASSSPQAAEAPVAATPGQSDPAVPGQDVQTDPLTLLISLAAGKPALPLAEGKSAELAASEELDQPQEQSDKQSDSPLDLALAGSLAAGANLVILPTPQVEVPVAEPAAEGTVQLAVEMNGTEAATVLAQTSATSDAAAIPVSTTAPIATQTDFPSQSVENAPVPAEKLPAAPVTPGVTVQAEMPQSALDQGEAIPAGFQVVAPKLASVQDTSKVAGRPAGKATGSRAPRETVSAVRSTSLGTAQAAPSAESEPTLTAAPPQVFEGPSKVQAVSATEPSAAKATTVTVPIATVNPSAPAETAAQTETPAEIVTGTSTTSAAQTAFPDVVPPSVGQQVLNRLIQAVRRGEQKCQLDLHPEALGRVHARLSFEADTLSLFLGTESSQAQRALSDALPELRVALENRGITVGQCNVGLLGGNSSSSFGGQQQGQHTASLSNRLSFAGETETARPLQPSAPQVTRRGLVDIMV